MITYSAHPPNAKTSTPTTAPMIVGTDNPDVLLLDVTLTFVCGVAVVGIGDVGVDDGAWVPEKGGIIGLAVGVGDGAWIVGLAVGARDVGTPVGGNDGDDEDVGAMLDRRRTQTTGLYTTGCVARGVTWHAFPGGKQEMPPADAFPTHPASLLLDSQ